jgi:hypothetical protein
MTRRAICLLSIQQPISMSVGKVCNNAWDLVLVQDIASWVKVDAWVSTTSKRKQICKKAWNKGHMSKQDILPQIPASVDVDNHLPPGSNLMRSGPCINDVGGWRISSLDLVEVGRVANVYIRSRINDLSVQEYVAC